MKKIFMTLALILCCTAVMAEQTDEEKAWARAEQKMKEADANPKDGKKQIEATYALLEDTAVFSKNVNLAQKYAERALEIANEQTVLQDTLKGLACQNLFTIYMKKGDMQNASMYMGMAVDAFQQELGRFDPLTNGSKLIYGYGMMGMNPFRAAASILDAFTSDDVAPQEKRIENMAIANIALEFAIEYLIVAATNRYRYALPILLDEGKPYIILQTAEWNMERPLVGWIASGMLSGEEEKAEKDPAILCDLETQQCKVLSEEEKQKRQLVFSFKQMTRNPRQLEVQNGSSFLLFFGEENYNKILNTFREFKASLKK